MENIFQHISKKWIRGRKTFEISTCDKMFYCVRRVNCSLCKVLSCNSEFFPRDCLSQHPTVINGQQNNSRCLCRIFFFPTQDLSLNLMRAGWPGIPYNSRVSGIVPLAAWGWQAPLPLALNVDPGKSNSDPQVWAAGTLPTQLLPHPRNFGLLPEQKAN